MAIIIKCNFKLLIDYRVSQIKKGSGDNASQFSYFLGDWVKVKGTKTYVRSWYKIKIRWFLTGTAQAPSSKFPKHKQFFTVS